MMRILKALVVLLVATNGANIARSEIQVGETLEWLADTCPHIGVYSSAAVKWESAQKDWITYAPVTAHLTRTLRGKLPETLTFDFPVWYTGYGGTKMYAQDNDQFLVFAREDERGELHTIQIINLSRPLKDKPSLYVALRPDFTVLTDAAKILSITEERVRTHQAQPYRWGDHPKARWVGVPMSSEAFGSLYGGSACFLLIPDDLLYIAKQHSHD